MASRIMTVAVGAMLALALGLGCGGTKVPAAAQDVATAARADLAGKIGAPAEQLAIAKLEEVAWGDAGLGCPQPGEFYAQVITPGYRIIFSYKDKEYVYHTDQRGRVILCTER